MSAPLLEIRNLSVEINTDEGVLRAVDGVSLTIEDGCVYGLVGESGCGKSMTAMSIPRLFSSLQCRVVSGEILFKGRDLLRMTEKELRQVRGKEIGVVFQEPMTALSPLKKIGEQVAEVALLHNDITGKAAMSLAQEWLEKVGIPDAVHRMHAYPFELSGGMRQRVMIAMALILKPQLIIADEPTTALDVTIQAQILELMREIKGEDSGLLLITHDMGVIYEMCDQMSVMYASRIVETGTVKSLFEHPMHPYTQGLMQSIPALNPNVQRLPYIPGQVPSLLHLPKGCAFAPRCPRRSELCESNLPPLREAEGRKVACWL